MTPSFTHCPVCHVLIAGDAAGDLTPGGASPRSPRNGDLLMCPSCGGIYRLTATGAEPVSEEVLATLPADLQLVIRSAQRLATTPIAPGGYYVRRGGPTSPLERTSRSEALAGGPMSWICRRVADFLSGTLPPRAATAPCTRCGAAIVYDPSQPPGPQVHLLQKVCMQCMGVVPVPFES